MLLALAVYLLMHDKARAKWKRVIPVLCIALSVGAAVSRSGIIAVAASLGVLVVSLPPTRRLKGLACRSSGAGGQSSSPLLVLIGTLAAFSWREIPTPRSHTERTITRTWSSWYAKHPGGTGPGHLHCQHCH